MNQTNTVSAPRTKTYEITMTALMAAVTCILAPLSISQLYNLSHNYAHLPILPSICPFIFSDGKKEPSAI